MRLNVIIYAGEVRQSSFLEVLDGGFDGNYVVAMRAALDVRDTWRHDSLSDDYSAYSQGLKRKT